MDAKGRRLLRRIAGAAIAVMLLCGLRPAAVMAGEIGLINTKEPLNILSGTEAAAAVLGKAVNSAHVSILAKEGEWVQIQAGTVIGWVPAGAVSETALTVEEAAEANWEIIVGIMQEGTLPDGDETGDGEPSGKEAGNPEAGAAENAENTGEPPAEENAGTQEPPAAEKAGEEGQPAAAAGGTEEQSAAEDGSAGEPSAAENGSAGEPSAAENGSAGEPPAEEKVSTEEQPAAAAAGAGEQTGEAPAAESLSAAEQALLLQQAEEALRQREEAQRQAAEAARRQQEEAVRQTILNLSGATADDLYLLANIIYCEAGCEPSEGKVAVGSVVMNRVRDGAYPNTIRDVIYDKGQFSPVRNGSLKRAMKVNRADAWCYQAALEALAGARPVGGCLYFRRVNGRSGLVLGHHVFY